MPISAKVSSTFHTVAQPWVKVSTTWRACKNVWAKVGSTWKLVYTAMTISLDKTSDSTNLANYSWGDLNTNPASKKATFTVTGGTAPITVHGSIVSGSSVTGFSFNDATYGSGDVITSNNGSTGVSVIKLTATDANGIAVSQNFTLTIT